MKVGINEPFEKQCQLLKTIIEQSKDLFFIIQEAKKLNLPNFYAGGGCIAQTVWNYQYDFDLNYGIEDIDLIYYEDNDLSEETENRNAQKVNEAFSDVPFKIDVKNQARVHLWYKQKFGFDSLPYTSSEHAIHSWPSTATAIGIYFVGDDLSVYAPYGLNDLFAGIIRPNKTLITKNIFYQKAEKWNRKWPLTKVIDW